MLTNTNLSGFTVCSTFKGQLFIDHMEDYDIGDNVMFLNSNNGFFSGTGWVIKAGERFGFQGHEPFETYTIGEAPDNELGAGGAGWNTYWQIKGDIDSFGAQAIDTFSAYTDTSYMNYGSGWSTPIEVKEIIVGQSSFDDFESYTDTSSLNAGRRFIGGWEVR